MLGVLSQLCCILLRGGLAPQIKLDFVYSWVIKCHTELVCKEVTTWFVICQRCLRDSVWERLLKCPLFFNIFILHVTLFCVTRWLDTTNIVAKFHYWKYKWLPTLCGHVTWCRTKDQQFSWYTVYIWLNAVLDQMLQMEAKLPINASLT